MVSNNHQVFWKYLVERMEICRMMQSKLDPCLFVGMKVIIWSHAKKDIHVVVMKLQEVGADLEQETDATGFLGI